jgi:hypothetical protein
MPFSRHSTGRLHLPADDGEQRLLAWNDPHHPRNPLTCLAGAAGSATMAMAMALAGMGIGGAILVVLLVLMLLGKF